MKKCSVLSPSESLYQISRSMQMVDLYHNLYFAYWKLSKTFDKNLNIRTGPSTATSWSKESLGFLVLSFNNDTTFVFKFSPFSSKQIFASRYYWEQFVVCFTILSILAFSGEKRTKLVLFLDSPSSSSSQLTFPLEWRNPLDLIDKLKEY